MGPETTAAHLAPTDGATASPRPRLADPRAVDGVAPTGGEGRAALGAAADGGAAGGCRRGGFGPRAGGPAASAAWSGRHGLGRADAAHSVTEPASHARGVDAIEQGPPPISHPALRCDSEQSAGGRATVACLAPSKIRAMDVVAALSGVLGALAGATGAIVAQWLAIQAQDHRRWLERVHQSASELLAYEWTREALARARRAGESAVDLEVLEAREDRDRRLAASYLHLAPDQLGLGEATIAFMGATNHLTASVTGPGAVWEAAEREYEEARASFTEIVQRALRTGRGHRIR